MADEFAFVLAFVTTVPAIKGLINAFTRKTEPQWRWIAGLTSCLLALTAAAPWWFLAFHAIHMTTQEEMQTPNLEMKLYLTTPILAFVPGMVLGLISRNSAGIFGLATHLWIFLVVIFLGIGV